MKLFLRFGLGLGGLSILPVCIFLISAAIGGLIPKSSRVTLDDGVMLEPPVYLTANALHADIAIPVNSFTLQRFSFLREAGFPLDNPNLKYLVVGWGSKAFYTSTKNYSDIELSTVWKAVSGDDAVMHVAPASDLKKQDGAVQLELNEESFVKLVGFIEASFKKAGKQNRSNPGYRVWVWGCIL